MKELVVYFSASGVTKRVGDKIASLVGADTFEIIPQEIYTDEDLNWMNENSRSSIEMKDKNSRPAMANHLDNIEEYDTIYLGFPIWWGIAPTIINTFIESHNLDGKKVITFATSGGSGMGSSTTELQEAYPNINFVNGKIVNQFNVEEFIKNI